MRAALTLQQSVNLYRDEFKPPSPFPSLVHGIVVLFLVILVGLVDYSFESSNLNAERQKLVKLQQDSEKFKKVIDSVNPEPVNEDSYLKAQLNRLRGVQKQRQQITRVLEKNVDRNLALFSEQLLAFARNHETGITITHFLLNNGENSIEFTGLAQSSAKVPHFLKSLHQDKALSGIRMGVLKVERSSDYPFFEFSLSALNDKASRDYARNENLNNSEQRSSLQGWRDLLKSVTRQSEGGRG